MTQPTVVSVGEILWDLLPTGRRAGGAPTNFVYHAVKNGAAGTAISAVGGDQLGDDLKKAVADAGITAELQCNAYPTGTVEVVLSDGIPEYTIIEGVAWDHLHPTDRLRELVAGADAVCFGTLGLRSHESRNTILELLSATKPGALKYFDINIRGTYYSRELIDTLLSQATVFKLNDEELDLLRTLFPIPEGGDEEAAHWFLETYGLSHVILTAGSHYSSIFTQAESSTIQTPQVHVVDTVGAGDSFSGTFTAMVLKGASLQEAHRAAVNAAAYVCTQAGAWPDYPATMPDFIAASEK